YSRLLPGCRVAAAAVAGGRLSEGPGTEEARLDGRLDRYRDRGCWRRFLAAVAAALEPGTSRRRSRLRNPRRALDPDGGSLSASSTNARVPVRNRPTLDAVPRLWWFFGIPLHPDPRRLPLALRHAGVVPPRSRRLDDGLGPGRRMASKIDPGHAGERTASRGHLRANSGARDTVAIRSDGADGRVLRGSRPLLSRRRRAGAGRRDALPGLSSRRARRSGA